MTDQELIDLLTEKGIDGWSVAYRTSADLATKDYQIMMQRRKLLMPEERKVPKNTSPLIVPGR